MDFGNELASPVLPTQRTRFGLFSPQLKVFRTKLMIVAAVEAITALMFIPAICFGQFPLYFLLLEASFLGCASFYVGFVISRQTGKIGLSLRACLIANLSYCIGLILTGAIASVVDLISFVENTYYDGMMSILGMMILCVAIGVLLIIVEIGALLVSTLGGTMGYLVGKRRNMPTLV